VVSAEAMREGRTLPALGIDPATIAAIVPNYLWRFRKTGQFGRRRSEVRGQRSEIR
jgi:NADH dehydrogenase